MAVAVFSVPLSNDYGVTITKTTGSAISPAAVQVLVDDAVVTNEKDFILLLDIIKQRLLTQGWPPA